MRTSADIYGEYLKDKMINEEQLANLKKVGTGMLVDFHNMCEELGIKYSLAYGTLLGAVRHKGYIPWDDDIDVYLFRKDYQKFKDLVNTKYSDKYFVLDNKEEKSYNLIFPKLILKNTKLVEVNDDSKPNRGVFIDLFLVDDAPKNNYSIRNKLFVLCCRLSSLKCDFKYPSKTLKERSKQNKEIKKYINARKFMGFFANFIPMKLLFWVRNKVSTSKKTIEKYVIVEDVLRYVDKDWLDDLSLYEFEGHKFYGSTNFDKVLKNCYGDTYMQLPPENKRERHIIVDLDLSKVM